MTFKTRYKNLDFNRLFLGILGDNLKKMTIISQIKAVTAIPIDLNQFCPFLVKITIIKGFPNSGTDLIIVKTQ